MFVFTLNGVTTLGHHTSWGPHYSHRLYSTNEYLELKIYKEVTIRLWSKQIFWCICCGCVRNMVRQTLLSIICQVSSSFFRRRDMHTDGGSVVK